GDYEYLLYLLEKELTDIHVPHELKELFEKIYRAHIRKEYISDPEVPKAPLLLFIGPSGSGKTATVTETVEDVIFINEVRPEIDLQKKKEELLAGEPIWKTLEMVDPDLVHEMSRLKKLRFYKRLSKLPLINSLFKKVISRNLSDLEEQSLPVDYAMVTPNDYQTALAGEPGNYFKKALGDPTKTAIRHVEEAHSAFGKASGRESGVERQQRTLIDTSNIVIDEIINGRRDCLLIATSDQPERFDSAIYRRFVEKGKIIDISDFWMNPDNLEEVVRLELLRSNIHVGSEEDPYCTITEACLDPAETRVAVDKLYTIFKERSLKVIPSYVRKLINSIVQIKGDFKPEYLDNSFLVRKAFELVAKNSYGDLFKKVVDRMDRNVKWHDYVGGIKDMFSEMSNNCLFYGVSEEKGVVLNGPPGGGKTFLVRAWLSENKDIHDIATSPSALQDPVNPVEGAIDNLEKVYDIAKMIAPTVIFFDEGDSLAPKRSQTGGSPSDRLTNKFLNLIDGEIPLNRVFTVLTTNRLDILDPALIRSKRLKVMEISGHMGRDDINDIVRQTITDIPMAPDLEVETIVESAKEICNTPADYTAFVEKALSLRNTEYAVLTRFRS
ncbi:MAG: AAA family ATPase, partial [Desulfobacterales bacterium]|nr:AAA family ATPase [Desulfobacterales bacterium]